MAGPIHLRAARLDDADSIADVQGRAWRETYAEEVPERVYEQLEREGPNLWRHRLDDPVASATWVGVERASGLIVGFAFVEAMGPGDVRPLRLSALYVLQQWHGQGLGRALLGHALGDAPAYLWVAESNDRAQRFYTRNGFALDGARQVEEHWGGITDLRMVR